MSDFEITGAKQLYDLSKALKAAGMTGKGSLRSELHKGAAAGAKSLIPKARKAARAQLPSQGGLNVVVAKSPLRAQVRTSESNYGVRIVGPRKKGSGANATNRGFIKHPTFGRGPSVTQKIPKAKDWFDDTMRRGAPEVRPEIQAAVERVMQKIIDGAGAGSG